MEAVVLAPTVPLELTLLLTAKVGQDLEGGAPALDLELPVHNNRRRHYNQMRAPDPVVASQRRQQRYRLNRLAEAHLVGEDAVKVAPMQREEPVEAFQLCTMGWGRRARGRVRVASSAFDVGHS